MPISFPVKTALLLICLSFVTSKALCQTDSVDIFIEQQMKAQKIPGLQLAIVKGDKITKVAHYGYANLQDSIPVSNQTVFTINSITKAFVGIAVIQLVEDGKLKLDAPIGHYLPDLPGTWHAVTVQQLLSHISGLPDIVDEEEAVMIDDDPDQAWEKVLKMPNEFKPGERFSYNQTNYLLLGLLINELSGLPFQEFIVKNQLEIVGMPKTIRSGFGATKAVVHHSAAGYQFQKGKLSNMYFSFPPFLQTAAGMSSNAEELAKWVIATRKMQLFKNPSSLTALWKPAVLNNGKTSGFSSLLNGYAAGWPVANRSEHPAVAPVGGNRSAIFVYPKDDLAIVILTNLSGSTPDKFIDELAGIFISDMKEVNGFGLSTSLKVLKKSLDKAGYKNAVREAKAIMASKNKYVFSETELNSWGYKLISQKRMTEALEVFKLNVYLYPNSANAFDSLGEVFEELENNEQAIINYAQSLKLNPQNKNAESHLKKLKAL